MSFSEANKYFRELLQPVGLFCGVSIHEIDRFLTNKYPIPIKRGVSRDTWGSGWLFSLRERKQTGLFLEIETSAGDGVGNGRNEGPDGPNSACPWQEEAPGASPPQCQTQLPPQGSPCTSGCSTSICCGSQACPPLTAAPRRLPPSTAELMAPMPLCGNCSGLL